MEDDFSREQPPDLKYRGIDFKTIKQEFTESQVKYGGIHVKDPNIGTFHRKTVTTQPVVASTDKEVCVESGPPSTAVGDETEPYNGSKSNKRRQRHHKKWRAVIVVAVVALALSLGLGLGLGLKDYRLGVHSPNTAKPSVCRGQTCNQIMAAATFDDQLHVFAIGNDTAMWTRAFDGDSWTGEWASLGGSFASQPSVVVWANGSRITVFGLDSGAFDTVSKERRDGEWSDTWRSMNGSGSAAISSCHVVADYDRADIFTRSIYARANIVHDWWHVPLGDWWGQHLPWDPTIGGTSKSAPAAVCRNSTIFHDLVIYDEASGSVMHDQWDNKTEKWIGWENRGGSFVGNPVLVSPSESRVDFFGIGTDGGMYHFSWDEESSYSELEALGGNFSSIPSVIVTTSQRLDVVAVGTDDKLKHRALINSTWILDWEDMGVFANSAPLGIACGNETSRRVGVFILDQNSEAQYASWLADDSPSWNGLAKFGSIGGNLTTKWQWEPY